MDKALEQAINNLQFSITHPDRQYLTLIYAQKHFEGEALQAFIDAADKISYSFDTRLLNLLDRLKQKARGYRPKPPVSVADQLRGFSGFSGDDDDVDYDPGKDEEKAGQYDDDRQEVPSDPWNEDATGFSNKRYGQGNADDWNDPSDYSSDKDFDDPDLNPENQRTSGAGMLPDPARIAPPGSKGPATADFFNTLKTIVSTVESGVAAGTKLAGAIRDFSSGNSNTDPFSNRATLESLLNPQSQIPEAWKQWGINGPKPPDPTYGQTIPVGSSTQTGWTWTGKRWVPTRYWINVMGRVDETTGTTAPAADTTATGETSPFVYVAVGTVILGLLLL